jgi:putative ABC transport system substrate-binding protein
MLEMKALDALADIKRLRVGGSDARPVFLRASMLAALTVRHAVPAIYLYRTFCRWRSDELRIGHFESYRLAGVYTGRVLKGENPAELPVMQATKFELVINLKTAKALGISVPVDAGARDEMIE